MDENQAYFDHMSKELPSRKPESEKGRGKGLFLAGMITGIAGALLVVAICIFGIGVQESLEARGNAGSSVRLNEGSAIDAELINKLQSLENTIHQYFYLHEVSNEELQEGLYRGLLWALQDPYSEYYSAEELEEILQQTEGIYYGIGAYVTLDTATSLPKISGVIEGTPAQEAGLRTDDIIYEVEGVSTYGMSVTEAVGLIKGPENSQVTLTIVRMGETDYLEFTLTRRKVEAPTVKLTMLEDDIAYIELTEFDEVSIDQFADALATARGSGMKGLILDLRGNPGGSVNAVVEMCRMILPEGMIVYTENKEGNRTEYTCDGKRKLEVPMTVLVDGNSASASEIMAGAIKDYGIGTLVGTTTFGKGIVQQILSFMDGSAVKITISSYFTPKGNNIHGIGIEPDIECPFDGEAYYGSEDHPDNQLEKAKQVLLEMMK